MAVGVRALVQRIQGSEQRLGVGIDEVDLAQVPAGVPDPELAEMAVAAEDLEAPAREGEGAVAAPLRAGDLGTKGAAEVITAGAGAADVGPGQIALERRASSSAW